MSTVCPVCPVDSLAQNFIDAAAAAELGGLIMASSTLTQLDLARSGMTNSCVFAFAKALVFNRSITELDLRGNSIRYILCVVPLARLGPRTCECMYHDPYCAQRP